MKIMLTTEAREFITKKDTEITLSVLSVGGGGRETHLPAVRRGRPSAGVNTTYQPITDNGITIWTERRIQPESTGKTVTIGLRRFLWIKQLIVTGAAVAATGGH